MIEMGIQLSSQWRFVTLLESPIGRRQALTSWVPMLFSPRLELIETTRIVNGKKDVDWRIWNWNAKYTLKA
jgi:hypothetical protein